MTSTTQTLTCRDCGAAFPWQGAVKDDSVFQWDFLKPRLCDACDHLFRDLAARRETVVRQQHWHATLTRINATLKATLPARFQHTDISHPGFKQSTWAKVCHWRPTAERPWLGFLGPTGMCKTRMAYLLLRELVLEAAAAHATAALGIPCTTWGFPNEKDFANPYLAPTTPPLRLPSYLAASHTSIAKWITDQYEDRTSAASEARRRLREARTAAILFIDDLGKAKATPAVTSQLFDLLDHRHAHNLTTIWTANSTPDQIAASLPEDTAAPFAGRLYECSVILRLK